MIETINIVNKEVSKTLHKSEDLIKAVNKFFWKQGVKKSIQSGHHTSIRIKNLGTLVTSRNKVNLKIIRTIQHIRMLNDPATEFKQKTKEERLKEKYDHLIILLQRRNDIAIAYKTNTDRTKQKYDTKANMGQQAPDSPRDCFEGLLFQGD